MTMAESPESQTSVTLLERLARSGEPDQAAWAQFVDHYGRKVYQRCLRWRLQEADAEDVTQAVLLKLAVRMKSFAYDPTHSFRAWLKTVAHHAWCDFVAARHRVARARDGEAGREGLESAEARDDLARRLDEQYDRELLETAMANVRPRTAPHNWQAFWLTAVEGLSAEEAAARLGMKIARVYSARNRVQLRLQEERRRLEGGSPSL
jgi:RNA polymerase sigma factor (sigma-70 family)